MPAMEVSASIFCARDNKRGTASIASTVALRAASAFISSGFCAGQMKLISVAPSFSLATSSVDGARTLKTMSAVDHASSAETIFAPTAA